MVRRLFAALGLLVAFAGEGRADCGPERFAEVDFTVCVMDPATVAIETFNLDVAGEPFENFDKLAAELAIEGKTLVFATNGGMFDDNLRPIGLYVENGEVRKKLNRRNGGGNFHLKPNGVFWIDKGKAGVTETEAFAKSGRKPAFATQSGPMLVINGALHPKFSADGASRKIRNGVGVTRQGDVVFAISEEGINFHDFALLFRDRHDCPNALFFDGSISGLFGKGVGQRGGFLPLGPMVGAYEMK